jgi:biopolymer transport protein ExbD
VRLARPAPVAAAIPLAPSAGVVLLLVLLFVVTTIRDSDRTRVDLPALRTLGPAAPAAPTVVLHEEPGPTGATRLVYRFSDGRGPSSIVGDLAGVRQAALGVTAREPRAQFVLEADGDIAYERIDEILDELRRAGVRRVLFAGRAVRGVEPER